MLPNFINWGVRLIHSQVTICTSWMSWYRGSIIVDAKERLKIDYPIALDMLLFKICELEKDNLKVIIKIDLKTKKLVKGEYELLLKRSKILARQENYAVAFSIVAEKVYGSGSLAKIK